MSLNKIAGVVAVAGTLGISSIGLGGDADAATTQPAAPVVVQHAQLTGWGGPGPGGGGWHGPGPGGWGGPPPGGLGWGHPGWPGPGGWGWGHPGWPGAGWGPPPPPPCLFGLCI
jgi:hypothetical protein